MLHIFLCKIHLEKQRKTKSIPFFKFFFFVKIERDISKILGSSKIRVRYLRYLHCKKMCKGASYYQTSGYKYQPLYSTLKVFHDFHPRGVTDHLI